MGFSSGDCLDSVCLLQIQQLIAEEREMAAGTPPLTNRAMKVPPSANFNMFNTCGCFIALVRWAAAKSLRRYVVPPVRRSPSNTPSPSGHRGAGTSGDIQGQHRYGDRFESCRAARAAAHDSPANPGTCLLTRDGDVVEMASLGRTTCARNTMGSEKILRRQIRMKAFMVFAIMDFASTGRRWW